MAWAGSPGQRAAVTDERVTPLFVLGVLQAPPGWPPPIRRGAVHDSTRGGQAAVQRRPRAVRRTAEAAPARARRVRAA